MTRRTASPLSRLARSLRRQPPRQGIPGALQRAAVALLPSPPSPPARAVIAPPAGELDVSRQRARRALLDARQAMGGMLGEGQAGGVGPEALGAAPPPDLDRLRAYLEESEQSRAALHEELAALRGEIARLRQRVETLEVAAAASSAVATGTPPEHVERATDNTERELSERVFPAGTVGTRVELAPPPSEAAIAAVIGRLQGEPLIEAVEPSGANESARALRITLRTPLRWEQFGALLERALERGMAPGEVNWLQGAVRVRLSEEGGALPARPPAPVAAEPDAGRRG